MLEKLKDTFDKSVAAVSVKSEALVESSRVRSQISVLQKKIDAGFAQLGSMFYGNWLAGNFQTEELAAECEKLKAFADEIEAHKERLQQIKSEESKILGTHKNAPVQTPVFCTNCGAKLDPNARFCTECGTQVKQ